MRQEVKQGGVGMTEKQRKFLQELLNELSLPLPKNISKQEASRLIDLLLKIKSRVRNKAMKYIKPEMAEETKKKLYSIITSSLKDIERIIAQWGVKFPEDVKEGILNLSYPFLLLLTYDEVREFSQLLTLPEAYVKNPKVCKYLYVPSSDEFKFIGIALFGVDIALELLVNSYNDIKSLPL